MKPILFNTEMVRAILDGRKTVTRRVVKPQPIGNLHHVVDGTTNGYWMDGNCQPFRPPYHPGDILYGRETWVRSMAGTYLYKATDTPLICDGWHPSIHMPKEAARLFLRVQAVRVERLQDITEEQAEAEGAPRAFEYNTPEGPVIILDEDGYFYCGFKAVWESTIPKAKLPIYGLDANPWVWVIGFEKISKEEALKGGEGNG